MVELNNPAARVAYWLERGYSEGGSNVPAMRSWCAVWGLDHEKRSDQSEAFRRGVTLIEAGVETRVIAEELAEADDMAVLGLEHYGQIEKTLQHFTSLGSIKYQSFFQPLGESGWYSIRLLATLVGQKRPEGWIDDSDQAALVDQARRLIDLVIAADDLTAHDKKQIVDALRRVEGVLLRVQISGGTEVERAVDGMIGNLFRVIMRRGRTMMDHPATKGVLLLANAVSAALGMGADFTQIAERLGLSLPGGDHPGE